MSSAMGANYSCRAQNANAPMAIASSFKDCRLSSAPSRQERDMRMVRPVVSLARRISRSCLLVLVLCLAYGSAPAFAEGGSLDEILSAVVQIKTFINPDGRTVENLGRGREGSGIVIDDNGLVLTIGYLMVEAYAAEIRTNSGKAVPADIVGYDYESGFGLLRAVEPLKIKPLPFGKSADVKERDQMLIASYGGASMAAGARVMAKREFAGGWEYLLDDAIFTAPPHPAWSGAALINRDGKLVGVGSLIVGSTTGQNYHTPGNMFVPIDRLTPILADLITDGHPMGPARPWLGITTTELRGHLVVGQVTPGGPAEKAGIAHGDQIVGVNGVAAKTLADFYRQVWAQGAAGVMVPLDVIHNDEARRVDVSSMNRLDHLRLKSTF
jgi:S1-C subfamily serine protease